MFRVFVFTGMALLAMPWSPCVGAGTAAAQATATAVTARQQAGSWFNNSQELFLERAGALTASDVDLWVTATKKARLSVDRADLGFTMPKFNPLFDANRKVVPGAPAKYAKRLGQLPVNDVAEWQRLTGGEPLVRACRLRQRVAARRRGGRVTLRSSRRGGDRVRVSPAAGDPCRRRRREGLSGGARQSLPGRLYEPG